MYLFQGVSQLQRHLAAERVNNRTVGFVPTMGALHEGHLALVRQSLAENQVTVCSIFVNPTQFNDSDDLKKYPRTPGKDLEKLAMVGCDVAFLPNVAEVYPPGLDTALPLDLAGLDRSLEGAHRPGHFAGVVQVVKRFLDLVEPHRLYLGQKDFQQQLIIRHMVQALNLPVKVLTVPTVREPDGLAMSSRNTLLDPAIRPAAPRL
ncbi:MAG: pantoate--beta-alanine ligase, partial [Lewinella sp.]|nr:pantoate--beta-alanine ligase [Lewinella sp.]